MGDHSSLNNYFKKPTLNSQQEFLAAFLSEFKLKIKHHKGKENKVNDAMSRRLKFLYEISFSEIKMDLKENIMQATKKYLEYQFLWKHAQQENSSKRL